MDLYLHPKAHIIGNIDFSLADVAPCHRFTAVGEHLSHSNHHMNGCLMTVSLMDGDGTVVGSSTGKLLRNTVEFNMGVSAQVQIIRVSVDPRGSAGSDWCYLRKPVARCEMSSSGTSSPS
jgi:hypothetical protein